MRLHIPSFWNVPSAQCWIPTKLSSSSSRVYIAGNTQDAGESIDLSVALLDDTDSDDDCDDVIDDKISVCSTSTSEDDNHKMDNQDEEKSTPASSSTWLHKLGTAAIVGGAVLATGGAVLTLAGFGTTGIVGGTVAASVQSSMGNIAAGSVFATLQSAGATGSLESAASSGSYLAMAGGAV